MLRRWLDKHGKPFTDGPELRLRHDRTHRAVGNPGTIRLVTLDSDGAEVDLPAPILRAITFAAGTLQDDDRVGLAQVDVEWDGYTTRIEAICALAEPIPDRPDIDEVYRLAAGEPAVAWVDMQAPQPDSALDKVTA